MAAFASRTSPRTSRSDAAAAATAAGHGSAAGRSTAQAWRRGAYRRRDRIGSAHPSTDDTAAAAAAAAAAKAIARRRRPVVAPRTNQAGRKSRGRRCSRRSTHDRGQWRISCGWRVASSEWRLAIGDGVVATTANPRPSSRLIGANRDRPNVATKGRGGRARIHAAAVLGGGLATVRVRGENHEAGSARSGRTRRTTTNYESDERDTTKNGDTINWRPRSTLINSHEKL